MYLLLRRINDESHLAEVAEQMGYDSLEDLLESLGADAEELIGCYAEEWDPVFVNDSYIEELPDDAVVGTVEPILSIVHDRFYFEAAEGWLCDGGINAYITEEAFEEVMS